MNLKRLWDTENKKTVRAIPTWDPHKKFQVWTDDDGSHLYVYANSKYEELNTANAAVSEYWPTVWKTLDGETVGYYLTNKPTNLYNWDEGDDVVNLYTVTLNVKNWVEEDGVIVAAEDQDPLRATRTPVSVQVPAGCIVAGDQSLTDEEMNAWMSSLDFMLPDSQDGDEPAASFKFTPAESLPEWSYISAQYNFDEIIDVEWAAADENNNVIITGDATLPIYLMKGNE